MVGSIRTHSMFIESTFAKRINLLIKYQFPKAIFLSLSTYSTLKSMLCTRHKHRQGKSSRDDE